MSTGVALLISPVTIAFCRRKSTRVTAVMGGLITALGCLFTSFASQLHQLFFSYGIVKHTCLFCYRSGRYNNTEILSCTNFIHRILLFFNNSMIFLHCYYQFLYIILYYYKYNFEVCLHKTYLQVRSEYLY